MSVPSPRLCKATMIGENTTALGPEALNMVMQNCSPHDLVVLRRVCRAFKQHIDGQPALWRSARKAICDAPEPSALPLKGQLVDADEIQEGLTEAEWALHLFTGAVSSGPVLRASRSLIHNMPLEIKRGFQAVPMRWLVEYQREWTRSHSWNLEIIGAFIREKEALNTSGRKKRMREFLRTPACIGLLQAFRRDLEDIDYATLARAYPEIVDQAACVKTGDLSMYPPGYRLHARDTTICPTCNPPQTARAYTVDTKLKKVVYLQDNGEPILDWKEPKRFMIGDEIQAHYAAEHPNIAPPFLRVTFACTACPTSARARLYCNASMISHQHRAHGPINPAW
ncbi:hypothetical protein K525DRAFT_212385 [Schizophyllum commune Loenen D]|nr:hypothetical protein K525DRAFT_212385 [Schizophyllum commune Loenen D]